MRKISHITITLVLVGLIIIISPIFFPIDWAYGKAILYSYIGLAFAISILKHLKSKKPTKTNIVVIVVFYVMLFALIVSSILSYPLGIITFG